MNDKEIVVFLDIVRGEIRKGNMSVVHSLIDEKLKRLALRVAEEKIIGEVHTKLQRSGNDQRGVIFSKKLDLPFNIGDNLNIYVEDNRVIIEKA